MFLLPKKIIIHIYEFDPTYKNIYDLLLEEFHLSTPYWIMISSLDVSNNFQVFRMNQKQALEKSNFWNQRYNNILKLNQNLNTQQLDFINNNLIVFNYPAYISDFKKDQPYFRERHYHKIKFNKLYH